jgi:hypothetical protein
VRKVLGLIPKLSEPTFEQEVWRIKHAAYALRPGRERDVLVMKARRMQIAVHLDAWLASPGLQPPR